MRHSLLVIFTLLLSSCDELLYTPTPAKSRLHKKYTIKNSHGIFHIRPNRHINLNEIGQASYYGKDFHNKLTAIGTKFDMHAYTIAHKTAHLPSVAAITRNNKTLIVLINDRGPFAKNRIADCSQRVARELGFEKEGHARVHIKALVHETLALRQNGGHIEWNGAKPFPFMTRNISRALRNHSHFTKHTHTHTHATPKPQAIKHLPTTPGLYSTKHTTKKNSKIIIYASKSNKLITIHNKQISKHTNTQTKHEVQKPNINLKSPRTKTPRKKTIKYI